MENKHAQLLKDFLDQVQEFNVVIANSGLLKASEDELPTDVFQALHRLARQLSDAYDRRKSLLVDEGVRFFTTEGQRKSPDLLKQVAACGRSGCAIQHGTGALIHMEDLAKLELVLLAQARAASLVNGSELAWFDRYVVTPAGVAVLKQLNDES